MKRNVLKEPSAPGGQKSLVFPLGEIWQNRSDVKSNGEIGRYGRNLKDSSLSTSSKKPNSR